MAHQLRLPSSAQLERLLSMQKSGAAAMARYTILDVLTPLSVVAVIVVNLFTQDAIDVAKVRLVFLRCNFLLRPIAARSYDN